MYEYLCNYGNATNHRWTTKKELRSPFSWAKRPFANSGCFSTQNNNFVRNSLCNSTSKIMLVKSWTLKSLIKVL